MAEPNYAAFAAGFDPIGDSARAVAGLSARRGLIANQEAGQLIANGDYAGGARALYGAGDLAGGQQAQERGATIGAAKEYAGGNFGAAKDVFAGIGDLKGVEASQQAAVQRFQAVQQYTKQALPVLQAAHQRKGAQGIVEALDALTPDLTSPAIGMKPEQIEQYKARAAADPQGFLSSLGSLALKQITFQKNGDDIIVLDQTTGQPLTRITPSDRATLKSANDTETRIQTPGSVVPLSGGAPASAASPAASSQVALNNPGNLRVPGSTTQFQRFESPQAGLVALSDQLNRYGARGINTITDLINTYAPPNENDTASYIKDVAAQTGIDPKAKIDLTDPHTRFQMMQAIVKREGNSGQQPQAAMAPGGQVLATTDTGRPAFRQATDEENISAGNPHGAGQVDAKGQYHKTSSASEIDNLDGDALDRLAKLYLVDGKPPTGRNAGVVQRIQQRAEDLDAEAGISPLQRRQMQSQYHATSEALDEVTKRETAIGAFEETARANAQKALDLIGPKLTGPTDPRWSYENSPVSNLTIGASTQQSVRRALGNKAVAELDTWLKGFAGEFTKVVAGSGSGGGSGGGVGEREENAKYFSSDQPAEALRTKLIAAQNEMQTRTQKLAGERQRLQGILRRAGATAAPESAASPAAPAALPGAGSSYRVYDANGNLVPGTGR